MVDTQRSQTDLLTNLFQDGQATGSISPQDARDLIVSVMGVYGEIYVNNASATQAITTSYAKLNLFTANGENAGVTPDHTNDRLTATLTGIYHVGFNLSWRTGNEGTLDATIEINQAEPTPKITVHDDFDSTGPSAPRRHTSASGLLSLTANDQIELFVAGFASETLTVYEAHLWAHLIG